MFRSISGLFRQIMDMTREIPQQTPAQIPPDAWDPIQYGNAQPTAKCLSTVMQHIADLNDHRPYGVFIKPEDDDVTKINVLVMGPIGTPYEGGFFHFLLKCLPDYPARPPLVRLMTTDSNRVRFNPSFYENGKVCLALLGTDTTGPTWTRYNTIGNVVTAIKSLLSNENPVAEGSAFGVIPAMGTWLNSGICYNTVLQHETIRVAVCDVVEDCLRGSLEDHLMACSELHHQFNKYKQKWLTRLPTKFPRSGLAIGFYLRSPLTTGSLAHPHVVGNGHYCSASKHVAGGQSWSRLVRALGTKSNRMQRRPLATAVAHTSISDEIARRAAAFRLEPSLSQPEQPSTQCLLRLNRDLVHIFDDPPPGVFVEPEENNITNVHAVVVGPDDTPYEGGFFHFALTCLPGYPARPPLVGGLGSSSNGMQRVPLAATAKASADEPAALPEPGPLPAALYPQLPKKGQSLPQCLQKIQRDLAEFAHHPPPGVFIEPEKEDITTIHAVLVGPDGTPYQGGFFHFVLKLPQDYPVEPPLVRFMTTDGGRVGFNQNLQADGNVCLTFPRPPWSAALSLDRCLTRTPWRMNQYLDTLDSGAARLSGYNDTLRYQTLRVAVCDAVEACILDTAPYPPALRETVLARFVENYVKYENAVSDHHVSSLLGVVFGASNVESQKYKGLLERLRYLYSRALKKNASSADKES
ncbi:hypothetical protein HPB49_022756 [Dermacentor silvarum]|uniref:Uncharacterized protein n=1 Tax=Dermacentor silvarum TaxID=543639 RepID=A0ACB8D8M0_DERSI|nr:hypothetical protein HPB49_022756 [Dermacentor silvarum]